MTKSFEIAVTDVEIAELANKIAAMGEASGVPAPKFIITMGLALDLIKETMGLKLKEITRADSNRETH